MVRFSFVCYNAIPLLHILRKLGVTHACLLVLRYYIEGRRRLLIYLLTTSCSTVKGVICVNGFRTAPLVP